MEYYALIFINFGGRVDILAFFDNLTKAILSMKEIIEEESKYGNLMIIKIKLNELINNKFDNILINGNDYL